jgi:hypothetical protein
MDTRISSVKPLPDPEWRGETQRRTRQEAHRHDAAPDRASRRRVCVHRLAGRSTPASAYGRFGPPWRSSRAVDPAVHQPVANLVVGGSSRWRVRGEPSNHLTSTVQMLLDRCSPMNVVMEQAPQALPVATLDRIEHIAHRWHLLRHPQNCKGSCSARHWLECAGNEHTRGRGALRSMRSPGSRRSMRAPERVGRL